MQRRLDRGPWLLQKVVLVDGDSIGEILPKVSLGRLLASRVHQDGGGEGRAGGRVPFVGFVGVHETYVAELASLTIAEVLPLCSIEGTSRPYVFYQVCFARNWDSSRKQFCSRNHRLLPYSLVSDHRGANLLAQTQLLVLL